ncbi:GAF domain-containing protein [Conexibacter arvalis]|uniref:PAS domain S-box-containing protein n=1 Tax=Conexibacter arvalis TaxID=912552 RepID=A0A840I8X3_9ACTN|nr:GAF domain-containing protein [Conexibacter arvalis]MBB4661359.1 PAS domain S-box-containing protein [Conexibacter arvalis]
MNRSRRIDADDLARRVANAVGDGSVVRLHDAEARLLRPVATAHRDPSDRAAPGARQTGPPDLDDERGWTAQAFRTGRPVRLAQVRLPVRDRGELDRLPFERYVGAVLIVPLRVDGETVGTVTAFRAPGSVPYTLREQALVESLLGRALRRSGGGAPQEREPTVGEREPAAGELLARSDAAVWATDLQGRTLFVSPAMSELLALPAGDVAGLPMTDFVDVPPLSLTGMVPDEPERGDRRLRRADGTQLWLQTSSTPLVDAGGRRRGTLTTVADVTERKTEEVTLRLRLDATRGLLRLVSEVLRGSDRAALLDASVAVAAELLDAWRVGVFELGDDGLLRLRAGRGWPRGAIGGRELPALRSPAELALRSDEPLVVRDLDRWERLVRTESVGEEVRSGCWIGIGGRGVLAVLEREPRAFSADEVDLLASLAEALTACMPQQARRRGGAAAPPAQAMLAEPV